jgi:hypothetical protein
MATEDGASTLAGDRKTLSPDATLIFPQLVIPMRDVLGPRCDPVKGRRCGEMPCRNACRLV